MTWYMIGALLLGNAMLYFLSAWYNKTNVKKEREISNKQLQDAKQFFLDREEKEMEHVRDVAKYQAQNDKFNREMMQLLISRVDKLEDFSIKRGKKK